MVRVLMFLVPLALTIYAVVDCIQTDDAEVRNLPKFVWILLILLFWIVGPIAWLVAGRPHRGTARGQAPWPSTQTSGFPDYERPRPLAPDDDPEFLDQLDRHSADEQLLKQWEDDLKRREDELRDGQPSAEPGQQRPEQQRPEQQRPEQQRPEQRGTEPPDRRDQDDRDG